MRTTLDIDDDVLAAAKELADLHGSTAGRILSELARKSLTSTGSATVRNGVPIVPRRPAGAPRATMHGVNALRD